MGTSGIVRTPASARRNELRHAVPREPLLLDVLKKLCVVATNLSRFRHTLDRMLGAQRALSCHAGNKKRVTVRRQHGTGVHIDQWKNSGGKRHAVKIEIPSPLRTYARML
jgi:hypothetical protein